MSDHDEHDLKFYVQRNIRYHMRRSRFFMNCHRWAAFFGLLFSSAAIGLITTGSPLLAAIPAVIVTVTSALDLVFGFADKAWLHNDLRRRYLAIEAAIAQAEGPLTTEQIRHHKAAIHQIEADEPPTMHALSLLVRNEVVIAIYGDEEAKKYTYHIPWFKQVTAQCLDWDTSKAKTLA